MHTLIQHDGERIKSTPLHEMDFNSTKWLDLHKPSPQELKDVAEKTGILIQDLKNYSDPDELPRVEEQEHYSLIIFKSSGERRQSKTDRNTTSIAFLVSEKLLITIHQEEVPTITDTQKLDQEKQLSLFKQGTGQFLHYLLEQMMRRYFSTLDEIEEEIDRVEDAVFAKPTQKTVKRIFKLKRTLIYFHKAMVANRDIFVTLQKDKNISVAARKRITELYYDVTQLLDVIATYRDVLTGTLDIYLSSVNNQMNLVMKKMTAYGSLILVPTFITGLYGMNFRVMPEIYWQYGYLFAWALIVMSAFGLWLYFKKKDWF